MAPPFCSLGTRFQLTNRGQRPFLWSSPNFGPKSGLNFSERPFFFWSSPKFEQENGLILGGKIFILVFIIYKISDFPAPPFQNPA